MFCTNCGAQIAPGQKFCNKCGAPVTDNAINVGAAAPNTENTRSAGTATPNTENAINAGIPAQQMMPPKKKKTWLIVLIILLIVLVVSICIAAAASYAFKKLVASLPSDEVIDPDSDPYGIEENLDNIEEFLENHQEDGEEEHDYLDELEDALEELEPVEGLEDEDGKDYQISDYKYATVTNAGDCVYIEGKDVIDGDTVIYNGKTVDELCDYIDDKVLEKGRKINRDMVENLIELNIVDPDLVQNDEDFENSMMIILDLAGEFGSQDVEFEHCTVYVDEPSSYYYDVELENDELDMWIVNFNDKRCYFDYGKTEYDSAGEFGMFSDATYAIWLEAIDQFFGIE